MRHRLKWCQQLYINCQTISWMDEYIGGKAKLVPDTSSNVVFRQCHFRCSLYLIQARIAVPKIIDMIPNSLCVWSDKLKYQSIKRL